MDTESIFSHLDRLAEYTLAGPARSMRIGLARAQRSVDYRTALDVTPDSIPDYLAGRRIQELIASAEPTLIARFGSTELRVVLRGLGRKNRGLFQKFYAAATRLEPPFWSPVFSQRVRTHSGFYPITRASITGFIDLMVESIPKIDLLGSWVPGENQVIDFSSRIEITPLNGLSPFVGDTPWTSSLEGKRVLVVHPFKDSIENQYDIREKLFTDRNFLPDFDLRVVKAVQSLGTPPAEFPTWFDGLQFMFDQCVEEPFDIAIIGCGSYGLPLASMLKSSGKSSIVLGGITQLLFGIKGKRWPEMGAGNNAWVFPKNSERPDGYRGADGGAYWA